MSPVSFGQKMGTDDNGDLGFQHSSPNPQSEKAGVMTMSSSSMFKSSNGGDPFYASGWDPLVSLNQSENFGGSSMVSHNEYVNSSYPVVLGNQGISGTSHQVHYPNGSGLVEMVPKLSCFGNGSFSGIVGSFGLTDCGQIAITGYPQNNEAAAEKASPKGVHSQEECQVSEEGIVGASSPNANQGKRTSGSLSGFDSIKNDEMEHQNNHTRESLEFAMERDDKKQKIEQNTGSLSRGKQVGKQAKDSSNSGESPKENYIHMRARRGQATNSHSLAERVRREKISERMRLLQELVPGCNKITGKAVMLDEIINYVQSLQQQVEFLSMKLATVNPELNIDIDRILSKDILHSRGLGFSQGISPSHPYPHGVSPHGILPNTPQYHPMPQNLWDNNELQTLLQMGFDSNTVANNHALNGCSKMEL